MVEALLKVGRRGEIYTTKELREAVGIRPGGWVRAYVEDGKVVVEPAPTIEDLIERSLAKLSPEEAEELSLEVQGEVGVGG